MNMLTKLAIGGAVALLSSPKGRKILSDVWSNLRDRVSADVKDAKEVVSKASTNAANSSKSWIA